MGNGVNGLSPVNVSQEGVVQTSAVSGRHGAVDFSAGFNNGYELSTDMGNIENIQNGNVADLPENSRGRKLLTRILAGVMLAVGIALGAAAVIASAGVAGVVGAAATALTGAVGSIGTTGMIATLIGLGGLVTLYTGSDSFDKVLNADEFIENSAQQQNNEREIDLENKEISFDELNTLL